MSKRAEAAAMKAVPVEDDRSIFGFSLESAYTIQRREGFRQGYEQAEKELALTLEQVVKLDNIIMNMVGEGYNDGYKTRPFYEEVLKRFNKERNEGH